MKPPSSFPIDWELLKSAQERLNVKRPIYWLLGASCTGKTTVCNCLALKGMTVCDMDARIFGDYLGKYTEARHPASCAWLKREDALHWALSLSWEEFNCLNEATNVEILDLFASEVQASTESRPIVVDGGLSHPYLLAQVMPSANVLCLLREENMRAGDWEIDEKKRQMKDMIMALPEGLNLWEKFLHFDKMISKTMADQCRQAGIRFARTLEGQPMSEVAESLLGLWGI
jgi:hypothetical protein